MVGRRRYSVFVFDRTARMLRYFWDEESVVMAQLLAVRLRAVAGVPAIVGEESAGLDAEAVYIAGARELKR